ncbi:MAG TPA: MFS transporter, partial [Pirellulales bacterium]
MVTFAGMAVNLCLGILYGWSVWKSKLLAPKGVDPGAPMTGLDVGWTYLTDSQATVAYAVCGLTFALFMIPGGWLQDKFGPRVGVTLGGLSLALGCILAGAMKSFEGLILGFGLLGGIGMGLGYAAATPAAVKWFNRQKRGLVVGLVVGGYGAAAIYISPLAKYLIGEYGISGSFYGLGTLFALVVLVAGQLLSTPPAGYTPPAAPEPPRPANTGTGATATAGGSTTAHDWTAGEMLRTWQFFALVFMFFASAQSGLLVIANAALILNDTAKNDTAETVAFFAANGWLLASYGGLVNAVGRVGTGLYSDRLGRRQAYLL